MYVSLSTVTILGLVIERLSGLVFEELVFQQFSGLGDKYFCGWRV